MDRFDLEFVEEVAVTAEGMGVPATAGRILGVLLICSPPHRTAGQLVELLDASAGAISQNLRLLEEWGLLERAPVPGSRSRHFRLRRRAWTALMEDRLGRVEAFRSLARRGLDAVGDDEERADRLREMYDYYDFMGRELPELLERYRASRKEATDD